jgi:hypothetical protein
LITVPVCRTISAVTPWVATGAVVGLMTIDIGWALAWFHRVTPDRGYRALLNLALTDAGLAQGLATSVFSDWST